MSILQRRRMGSMLWSALASLAWLALSVLPAHANRFGPPRQSRVVVDRATLFSQPDAGSAPTCSA